MKNQTNYQDWLYLQQQLRDSEYSYSEVLSQDDLDDELDHESYQRGFMNGVLAVLGRDAKL